jgi:hypothetical protein
VTDPFETAARAAERDADSAELYAPPADDKAPPSAPFPVQKTSSPALVGFLCILVITALSSAVAGGFMVAWYNVTPIKSGFLSGLEEFLLGFLAWVSLTVFAILSSLLLASGILGQGGKVTTLAWVMTAIFGVLAAGVCFIPEPPSTFAARGLFGVFSELISLGLAMIVLKHARRKYLGPPPPPPWMDPQIAP